MKRILFKNMNSKQLDAYTTASKQLGALVRYHNFLLTHSGPKSNQVVKDSVKHGTKAVKAINGIDGFNSQAYLNEHLQKDAHGNYHLLINGSSCVANPTSWIHVLKQIGIED